MQTQSPLNLRYAEGPNGHATLARFLLRTSMALFATTLGAITTAAIIRTYTTTGGNTYVVTAFYVSLGASLLGAAAWIGYKRTRPILTRAQACELIDQQMTALQALLNELRANGITVPDDPAQVTTTWAAQQLRQIETSRGRPALPATTRSLPALAGGPARD